MFLSSELLMPQVRARGGGAGEFAQRALPPGSPPGDQVCHAEHPDADLQAAGELSKTGGILPGPVGGRSRPDPNLGAGAAGGSEDGVFWGSS